MPVLLLLAFPVMEIWLLFRVGAQIGFVNTVFSLLAAAILGGGIAKAQGRFMLRTFQTTLAQGQVPTSSVFHSLLIFLGGILLFIPGYVSDFFGLLFILPGSRHLFARWLRLRMQRQVREGTFRAFSMGFGNGFGFGGTFGGGAGPGPQDFRDVSPKSLDASSAVIDVEPTRRENKSDGSDH